MGYPVTISGPWYSVKQEGEYPWPIRNHPDNTALLFTDDVLTKQDDGTFMRHTDMCIFGIILTDDEIAKHTNTIKGRIL